MTVSETVTYADIRKAGEAVRAAAKWGRFKAIRDFYALVTPLILKSESHQWAIDPYAVDWPHIFTPIEFGVWCDIRSAGIVLYPQFPIGRYFADFAHPVSKVAVECDGAAYHQDREKDDRRQKELRGMGWTVHRIPGWQCVAGDEVFDEEKQELIPNPDRSGLILREIAMRHGLIWRSAE